MACCYIRRDIKISFIHSFTVAKAPASPRNSTWFTRPFLLVRGWGLSLVPRPSPAPVFDRLQYAKTEPEGLVNLTT